MKRVLSLLLAVLLVLSALVPALADEPSKSNSKSITDHLDYDVVYFIKDLDSYLYIGQPRSEIEDMFFLQLYSTEDNGEKIYQVYTSLPKEGGETSPGLELGVLVEFDEDDVLSIICLYYTSHRRMNLRGGISIGSSAADVESVYGPSDKVTRPDSNITELLYYYSSTTGNISNTIEESTDIIIDFTTEDDIVTMISLCPLSVVLDNISVPSPAPGQTSAPTSTPAPDPTSTPTPTPAPTYEPTPAERGALSKAHDYLKFTAFSYTGLIGQLEYEGYDHDAAVYGADNCGADWDAQAVRKAKNYLEFSAFSYTGLIGQLEYEGFTHDEAVYGADNCEADWNEQAAKKAASYLDIFSYTRSGLISQLTFDGFTAEQAEYAASQNGL